MIDKQKNKKIPSHIGIIMDGNGRWAKKKGLNRIFGHEEGVKRVREIVEASVEADIKTLTLYSFSTENWSRPEKEVKFLLSLFKKVFQSEIEDLKKKGVKVRVLGRRDERVAPILNEIELLERETEKGSRLNLNIALNYGGRAEIVDAVRKIISKDIRNPENITEDLIYSNLYLPFMPDPDLLIRTGGEKRISNFLLWEIAYTELWFTDTLWPDFKKDEYFRAIEDYSRRKRKFGKVEEDA